MSRVLTTWREEFEYVRKELGDTTPIVAVGPDASVLDVEFDDGYGAPEGKPFLIWTEEFVYFPVCYDGSERVGSAPRNPRPEGQSHVGGW